MKFLHTGDWHIGKTVNDFSMLEDQRHILNQIIAIARQEEAEAVVVAGDIYDRAIPTAEAVTLLDDFLTRMGELEIPVLLISGNHDSPERVGFMGEILRRNDIYLAGVYKNKLTEVTFTDAYGEVVFVLLPFVKPAVAAAKTSGEAVGKMLEDNLQPVNKNGGRSVLVTHYFVTNSGKEPELSDGETTIHVGGLDNVEASLFNRFDYTALGHIHKPQQIGENAVYYAGAPLAYSFSEAGQTKYVNLVELKEKGNIAVEQIPLKPLHEMRKIRGRLEALMAEDVANAADRFDYIQARLTNDEELIDPIGALRKIYPNIMQIVLEKNERPGRADCVRMAAESPKSLPELFAGFYEMVREEKLDEERLRIVTDTARAAEGGMDI